MNADDLPIGTRVRPVYPGRPDGVVYRKVNDGPWGWCLERAGGAIASQDITQRVLEGSIEILLDGPGDPLVKWKALAARQAEDSQTLVTYNRDLVAASRALLDAVTDTYVSPGRVAAHARLGLAHQNLERLLAANGDLP